MGRKIQISIETRRNMLHLAKQGYNAYEIADKCNVSPGSVHRHLGILNSIIKYEDEDIYKKYKQERSVKKLAEEYKMSEYKINKIITKCACKEIAKNKSRRV